MDPKFFRKYADLIVEAEQSQQLDEGLMDKLKPYMQKLANVVLSKLDPETLNSLKQAYDAAGGDKEKFMANIGITKQDLAPLMKNAQQAPVSEEWEVSSLKGKILTVLMNAIPSLGILDLVTGGNLGQLIGDPYAGIWYVVSAALMWGIGAYDFTDRKNAPADYKPKPDRTMAYK